MNSIRPDRPITELIGELVNQVTALIRTEGRLARTELSEQITKMTSAALIGVVGAVILLPGVFILLQSAVAALIRSGMPDYIAALIVGGGVIVLGTILLLVGIKRLKATHLFPNKTLQQLHRDVAVVKHVGHTNDKRAA